MINLNNFVVVKIRGFMTIYNVENPCYAHQHFIKVNREPNYINGEQDTYEIIIQIETGLDTKGFICSDNTEPSEINNIGFSKE